MTIVVIDDIRDVLGAHETLRDFWSAATYIRTWSLKDSVLYLDHDLGSTEEKENGWQIAKLIAKLENYPKEVILVSSNPVGCTNMENVFMDSGKYSKLAHRFYKRID